MKNKIEILLGSEDVRIKNIVDLFLNIDAKSSFREIKKGRYDNDFDLLRQFELERNECRNFCIYGVVDSNVVDSDNLQMFAYSDSGLTNNIGTINTSSLVFDERNIFDKKRGKYFFSINNYSADTIYIHLPSNNFSYQAQTFERRVVYYDENGVLIPYGTETIDILNNGQLFEVNNDFPFFYNIHWVKRNINIQEEKPAIISFQTNSYSISEGDSVNVNLVYNKPSIFGIESYKIGLNTNFSNSADTNDYLTLVGGSPITFPYTVNVPIGQQSFSFEVVANNDNLVEITEKLDFNIYDLVNCLPGDITGSTVNILDTTPRPKAILNFGEGYANRVPFTGTQYTFGSTSLAEGGYGNAPSILRNGYFFDGQNNEFYQLDKFNLSIKNNSTTATILPINPALGVSNEETWAPGQIKNFTVNIPYNSNSTTASVEIDFNGLSGTSNIQIGRTIIIDGFDFLYVQLMIGYTLPDIDDINYNTPAKYFFALVNGGVHDFYAARGIEKPFTATLSGQKVILNAISRATPLNTITTNNGLVFSFTNFATATTINPYIYQAQTPIEIELIGNDLNSSVCNYEIIISKPGFQNLIVNTNSTVQAFLTPATYYLSSGLQNVLRNFDDVDGQFSPILYKETVETEFDALIQDYNFAYTFFYPLGSAIINGFALLGIRINYTGLQSNITKYGSSNISSLAGTQGLFLSAPTVTLPETSSELSVQDRAKKVLLAMSFDSIANTRSFQFRVGSDPFYTYSNSVIGTGADWVNSVSRNNLGTLTLKQWLETGGVVQGTTIPSGQVNVYNPGIAYSKLIFQYNDAVNLSPPGVFYFFQFQQAPVNIQNYYGANGNAWGPDGASEPANIVIESQVPGVNFDIQNLVGQIRYYEIFPNEVAGVTTNPFNNRMGGYALN